MSNQVKHLRILRAKDKTKEETDSLAAIQNAELKRCPTNEASKTSPKSQRVVGRSLLGFLNQYCDAIDLEVVKILDT